MLSRTTTSSCADYLRSNDSVPAAGPDAEMIQQRFDAQDGAGGDTKARLCPTGGLSRGSTWPPRQTSDETYGSLGGYLRIYAGIIWPQSTGCARVAAPDEYFSNPGQHRNHQSSGTALE